MRVTSTRNLLGKVAMLRDRVNRLVAAECGFPWLGLTPSGWDGGRALEGEGDRGQQGAADSRRREPGGAAGEQQKSQYKLHKESEIKPRIGLNPLVILFHK